MLLLWPVLPMACLHYKCGSLTWLSLWDYLYGLALEAPADDAG